VLVITFKLGGVCIDDVVMVFFWVFQLYTIPLVCSLCLPVLISLVRRSIY